jgi:hypothetical protein
MWIWVTVIYSIVATGLIYFREEYIQNRLFHQSKIAVENGDFVVAEKQLGELLKINPEFQGAAELINEIDGETFIQSLPLEFTAKHNHRVGSCTGRLLLHEWGVEYFSDEHGRWRWRFDQILAIRRESEWKLHLETDESDLLGLFKTKSYNFSIQNTPLRDEDWQKYYRLTQNSRTSEPVADSEVGCLRNESSKSWLV